MSFTEEFPNSNYQPTLNSTQEQSKFWPAYLENDQNRVFIFERSKNAQLVVYAANFNSKNELYPKWPLDIYWQSFGWSKADARTNATGMVERKMAWGYKHKVLSDTDEVASKSTGDASVKYRICLSAMPQRVAVFYVNKDQVPVLEVDIGGQYSRLEKVFVKTADSNKFIPTVEYVELFGKDCDTNEDTYEKYIP